MPKPPLSHEQRLVLRFEEATDESPLSEKEARELLAADGVDVDAEFAILVTDVKQRAEDARRAEMHGAAADWQQFRDRRKPTLRARSREENLARVQVLRTKRPELTVQHRDLTHVSDDDLASLVEQLEELAADDREE